MHKYLNHAYKAKLPIVMGTDIGSAPWNINETKELEYYVRAAGLTPMDAIKTATLNAASLLHVESSRVRSKKGLLPTSLQYRGTRWKILPYFSTLTLS